MDLSQNSQIDFYTEEEYALMQRSTHPVNAPAHQGIVSGGIAPHSPPQACPVAADTSNDTVK